MAFGVIENYAALLSKKKGNNFHHPLSYYKLALKQSNKINLGYFPYLWAAIAYFITFGYYTWPLIPEFNVAILGISSGTGDAPSVLQNVYHVQRVLQGSEAPFFTHYLFHPMGNTIWMHGNTWLPSFIACLPPSPYAGINLVMLLSFMLSGLGAMWLAQKLNVALWPAFVVGFIYAFSPYKLYQAQDHLWYILTATVPFYVYQIIALFQNGLSTLSFNKKVWLRLLYATLLGIITALSDYYTTFILLIFSTLYASFSLFGWGKIVLFRKRKFWIGFAILTLLSGAITSYLDSLGVDNKQANSWAIDVLSYLLPLHNEHMLLGAEKLFGISIQMRGEGYLFLGFAFLLFTIIIMWQRSPTMPETSDTKAFRLLALITFIFFLLTLPLIIVGGHMFIPGPLAWFQYIPFLNNIRVSSRFFLLFSLLFPLLVLAIPLRQHAKFKIPVYALLSLLLFFEYRPKGYDFVRQRNIPEIMFQLAEQQGEVLLQIPSGIRDGFQESGRLNTNDLWYQGIHGKKLTGGYHSRLPESFFAEARKDDFYAGFYALQTDSNSVVSPLSQATAKIFIKHVGPDWLLIAPGWQQHPVSKWLAAGLKPYCGDTIENSGYLLISLKHEADTAK